MMPDSVKADLSRTGTQWAEYHNLDQVIAKSDVLYATRVQKERFESLAEYESVKDMFIINNDLLTKAKESAIVMHPLPRVNEIDPEVDFDSRRAAYFRQMRYGLFVSAHVTDFGGACADLTGPNGFAHHGPRRIGWVIIKNGFMTLICFYYCFVSSLKLLISILFCMHRVSVKSTVVSGVGRCTLTLTCRSTISATAESQPSLVPCVCWRDVLCMLSDLYTSTCIHIVAAKKFRHFMMEPILVPAMRIGHLDPILPFINHFSIISAP